MLLFATIGCDFFSRSDDEWLGSLNGKKVSRSEVMVGKFAERLDQLRAQENDLIEEAFQAFVRDQVVKGEAIRLGTSIEELFEPFELLKSVKVTEAEIENFLQKKRGAILTDDEKHEIQEARLAIAKRKYIEELVQRSSIRRFQAEQR
jgi:hypothetical protein